ncbi:hypothetical protein [Paenibacillus pinistramenti]|uniref:hypothetical protein n=1 Tax=Paenibacillus pinistramenti TaxID=1768003 RepID=UPI00110981BE|nr:hypothetical protein [Paenibacillus pinistramenti]
MSSALCHVFLADIPEKNHIMTTFCIKEGYSKEEAQKEVNDVLTSRKIDPYTLYYLGVIDYHELDPKVGEKKDEFFDRYESVWILNCSYNRGKSC